MSTSTTEGNTTNPHALKAIVQASETHRIIASRDIVDIRGLKLWAKGQPVSKELQQRLLERKLLAPIEACLETEDGASLFTVVEEIVRMLDGDSPLAKILKPWGTLLVAQAKQLPLHSVAQLLLTAALTTRPSSFPHAVMGMGLAGAIVASRNSPVPEIRLAMLGGLLHDIGEVYIQPEYLDYSVTLDLQGHKHLMVHPRAAEVLLSSTTDYPKILTRGIGEHHERLDRSGYPMRLGADQISKLGRVLMVTEVALGMFRTPHSPLTKISFALRAIPGEFDPAWTGFLCDSARRLETPPPLDPLEPRDKSTLEHLDTELLATRELADHLQTQRGSAAMLEVVEQALARLDRLRVAWNALGVWGVNEAELSAQERFELTLAGSELKHRLRCFKRECLLLAENLSDAEKNQLAPLWDGLFDSPPPHLPAQTTP